MNAVNGCSGNQKEDAKLHCVTTCIKSFGFMVKKGGKGRRNVRKDRNLLMEEW